MLFQPVIHISSCMTHLIVKLGNTIRCRENNLLVCTCCATLFAYKNMVCNVICIQKHGVQGYLHAKTWCTMLFAYKNVVCTVICIQKLFIYHSTRLRGSRRVKWCFLPCSCWYVSVHQCENEGLSKKATICQSLEIVRSKKWWLLVFGPIIISFL